MKWLFIAGFMCLIASKSVAETTGNEFFEACDNAQDVQCGAYVRGVIDTTLVVGAGKKGSLVLRKEDRADVPLRHYCMPDGVTQNQIMDMVLRYLEKNPADRHHRMPLVIYGTMIEAFPCD